MATTDEYHALVQQQATEIRALRDELAAVRRRLDEVEARPGTDDRPTAPRTRPRTRELVLPQNADELGDGEAETKGVDHEVTDRRELLRRAGVAAAAAAAGGTAAVLGTATPAAAAQGTFDGSPAVIATGTGPGNAIAATSNAFVATVDARNGSGTGIYAQTSGATSNALWASSIGGAALLGTTNSGYPLVVAPNFTTAKAHLVLDGPAAEPPDPDGLPVPTTRTDTHRLGEIVLDVKHDLWLCVAPGTPGTWRRLGGGSTAGALVLLTTPVRVYDSRPGNPPNIGSKTPVANGTARTIDTKVNGSGVPAGATGVLVNLTVVNTSASGFLAAYKAGASVPDASSINWFTTGEIVANTTVVACNATAQIALYVPPTSSTDVLVDVIGYYR
jgi:hypothetical protein